MNLMRPILIITIISITSAAGFSADELLRDDYVISGADGLLVETQDGQWQFEFEEQLSDGAVTLTAGRRLLLLKSAALEKMILDAEQRPEARYRLWGKVTKFGGKNYVFPSYFVGLRKLEERKHNTNQIKQQTQTAGQTINSPNDIVKIPEDIIAQLSTSEILPASETQSAIPLKQDTILANRVGRIYEEKGRYFFKPDGFGLTIETDIIELLPCQALYEALKQVNSAVNPLRFNIAGIMTKYKGQQLLLLQRATRVYSYGNFGR